MWSGNYFWSLGLVQTPCWCFYWSHIESLGCWFVYFVVGTLYGCDFVSWIPRSLRCSLLLNFVDFDADCSLSIDDRHEDAALLYVWLWDRDGSFEYDKFLDGLNELTEGPFEDSQLLVLYCFLGRKLYEVRCFFCSFFSSSDWVFFICAFAYKVRFFC